MKKDDRERLEIARVKALEDIDANVPWFSAWDGFKERTTLVLDKEFRQLINGTDSMIRRSLLNNPKRMRRWIENFMPMKDKEDD